MKKADIYIIIFFLAAAALGVGYYIWQTGRSYDTKSVVIYVDKRLYKSIDVSDKNCTEEIEVKDKYGENIIKVTNGGAQIIKADCHDEICVKTGFVDKPGQTIVCLPHKLVVEIKGQNAKAGVDAYSY